VETEFDRDMSIGTPILESDLKDIVFATWPPSQLDENSQLNIGGCVQGLSCLLPFCYCERKTIPQNLPKLAPIFNCEFSSNCEGGQVVDTVALTLLEKSVFGPNSDKISDIDI
jgi:hypothetical protein